MNLDLKCEKINYMEPVYRGQIIREETLEVIVPDAMPDILRLIDTNGIVTLRGKDAEDGRVMIAGNFELSVLYVPENGEGIRKLDVNIPFTATGENGKIEPDVLITTRAYLMSCDSRMANPRKIVVRAEVCCDTVCYHTAGLYQCHDISAEGVFMKYSDSVMCLPSAVNEKVFVFTDTLSMPSGAEPIDDILRTDIVFGNSDVKAVGTKAVVKGQAATTVCYSGKDNRGIYTAEFTTPFSQIVDTDSLSDPSDFDVRIMPTAVYVSKDYPDENGNETVQLEVHAVIQCVSYVDYTINYLSDVYSPTYELTEQVDEYAPECISGKSIVTDTVKVTLPVQSAVQTVNTVSMHTMPAVSMAVNGGTTITSAVVVSVVYSGADGAAFSTVKKFEVKCETDIVDCIIDCSAVLSGQAFTAASDGGIDVRFPIEYRITKYRCPELRLIGEIEYNEEKKTGSETMPSVIIVRAGNNVDLWELAKRYSSSIEMIETVNSLGENKKISCGDVILIPRIK